LFALYRLIDAWIGYQTHVRISTASGSERDSTWSALATARGTDPARLPVHAIANRSNDHVCQTAV